MVSPSEKTHPRWGQRSSRAKSALGARFGQCVIVRFRHRSVLCIFASALARPRASLRRVQRVASEGVVRTPPDIRDLQALRSFRTHLRRLGHPSSPSLARVCRIGVVLDCRHRGSIHTVMPREPSNQAMERTAGSFGSSPFMKFRPQPAATRFPASRRSSYSR